MKQREAAVQKLAAKLVEEKDAARLRQLLADLRPSFASIPKAKTAKMVRQLLDSLAAIPGTTDMQLEVCKEQVWKHIHTQTPLKKIGIRAAVTQRYMPRTHSRSTGKTRGGTRLVLLSHAARVILCLLRCHRILDAVTCIMHRFALLTCAVVSICVTRVLRVMSHVCVCSCACVTVGMGAHRAQDVPETTHRHTSRTAVLGNEGVYAGSHTDIDACVGGEAHRRQGAADGHPSPRVENPLRAEKCAQGEGGAHGFKDGRECHLRAALRTVTNRHSGMKSDGYLCMEMYTTIVSSCRFR